MVDPPFQKGHCHQTSKDGHGEGLEPFAVFPGLPVSVQEETQLREGKYERLVGLPVAQALQGRTRQQSNCEEWTTLH